MITCSCPAGAHLTDLTIPTCGEKLGQVQKILIQRIYSATGVKNSIAAPATKASWTTLLSAADGTKVIVSPYLMAPTFDGGAEKTYGSDNQVLGGIPMHVGSEPITFTSNIHNTQQSVIVALKAYMCEDQLGSPNLGVYLLDDKGQIQALADDLKTPTKYYPIPVANFFVGDKKPGGLVEPDTNVLSFSFFPGWSDSAVVIAATDFNPVTDLVNVSSTS